MAYLTKRASLWYAIANAIATAPGLEAAELLPTDTLYTSALLKSSMFPLRQALSLFQRPLVSAPRLSHSVLNPRSLSLRQKSRPFSSSPRRPKDASSVTAPRQGGEASAAEASTASSTAQTHLTFKPPEPRLSLTFTCTAEGCHTRSTHQFTRRSYEKGIVLVECPGCKNRQVLLRAGISHTSCSDSSGKASNCRSFGLV